MHKKITFHTKLKKEIYKSLALYILVRSKQTYLKKNIVFSTTITQKELSKNLLSTSKKHLLFFFLAYSLFRFVYKLYTHTYTCLLEREFLSSLYYYNNEVLVKWNRMRWWLWRGRSSFICFSLIDRPKSLINTKYVVLPYLSMHGIIKYLILPLRTTRDRPKRYSSSFFFLIFSYSHSYLHLNSCIPSLCGHS